MKSMLIATAGLLIAGSADAQPRTTASPAAADHAKSEAAKHAEHGQREHCEAMEKTMGTKQQHSHAEMKGMVAQAPMNRVHMDCQKMKKKAKDGAEK